MRLIPPNSCIIAHAKIPGTMDRPIEIRLYVEDAALVAHLSHLQRIKRAQNAGRK